MMENNRKKILMMNTRYLPGYKDGGPLRTVKNVSDILGDEYDIRVLCLDRDYDDTKPYDGIKVDEYNTVGKAKVFYASSFSLSVIRKLANECDLVYCCGPYGTYSMKSLLLNRLGLIKVPYVLAPQGSFSPGAYAIKNTKKKFYITVMKMLGMFRHVYWSVTSKMEEQELAAVIGNNLPTYEACDLPRNEYCEHTHNKEEGVLKVIFLSRICVKKNLEYAIKSLAKVDEKKRVIFHIYGFVEDAQYWEKCKTLLEQLPKNIEWEYKGEADAAMVPKVFADYDLFFFPTMGENYGHVIAESLMAGCPVMISDQTPWHDCKDYGCGFEYPLDAAGDFSAKISELVDENSDDYKKRCDAALSYIRSKNEESIKNSGYRTIFDIDKRR